MVSLTVNRANTTDQTQGVAVSHHETQEVLVPVTGKVMSPPIQSTRRWHRRRHIRLYQTCYYGRAQWNATGELPMLDRRRR